MTDKHPINFERPKMFASNGAAIAAIFVGSLLTACQARHNSAAETKELDGRVFKYDQVDVEIIDRNDKPVEGVAIFYAAKNWDWSLWSAEIPLPNPHWVKKPYTKGLIGMTDADGKLTAGPISAKASGILSIGKPVEFELSAEGVLPKECWITKDVQAIYELDFTKVLEAYPQTGAKPLEKQCGVIIAAETDTYKTIHLKCRIDGTAEYVKEMIASARKRIGC